MHCGQRASEEWEATIYMRSRRIGVRATVGRGGRKTPCCRVRRKSRRRTAGNSCSLWETPSNCSYTVRGLVGTSISPISASSFSHTPWLFVQPKLIQRRSTLAARPPSSAAARGVAYWPFAGGASSSGVGSSKGSPLARAARRRLFHARQRSLTSALASAICLSRLLFSASCSAPPSTIANLPATGRLRAARRCLASAHRKARLWQGRLGDGCSTPASGRPLLSPLPMPLLSPLPMPLLSPLPMPLLSPLPMPRPSPQLSPRRSVSHVSS